MQFFRVIMTQITRTHTHALLNIKEKLPSYPTSRPILPYHQINLSLPHHIPQIPPPLLICLFICLRRTWQMCRLTCLQEKNQRSKKNILLLNKSKQRLKQFLKSNNTLIKTFFWLARIKNTTVLFPWGGGIALHRNFSYQKKSLFTKQLTYKFWFYKSF